MLGMQMFEPLLGYVAVTQSSASAQWVKADTFCL